MALTEREDNLRNLCSSYLQWLGGREANEKTLNNLECKVAAKKTCDVAWEGMRAKWEWFLDEAHARYNKSVLETNNTVEEISKLLGVGDDSAISKNVIRDTINNDSTFAVSCQYLTLADSVKYIIECYNREVASHKGTEKKLAEATHKLSVRAKEIEALQKKLNDIRNAVAATLDLNGE